MNKFKERTQELREQYGSRREAVLTWIAENKHNGENVTIYEVGQGLNIDPDDASGDMSNQARTPKEGDDRLLKGYGGGLFKLLSGSKIMDPLPEDEDDYDIRVLEVRLAELDAPSFVLSIDGTTYKAVRV